MKNLITMMNAMKYYKYEELIQESEDFQDKLSREMNRPTFHKLMGKIRDKFFLKQN